MAIRRERIGKRVKSRQRSRAEVAILPTISAMNRCFEEYLNLAVANGKPSEDTIATYRSRLKQFLDWCELKKLYPALLGKHDLLEYRKYLIEKPLAIPSITLSLLTVKHFYTACIESGLVESNPVLGVKAPKEKRIVGSTIKYLTTEQLQQVMDLIEPKGKTPGKETAGLQYLRDTILIGLMALQGCRTIELHRANWQDFLLEDGVSYLTVDGKTSIRTISLRQDLRERLVRYRALLSKEKLKIVRDAPMFVSLSNAHYGDRLSRRGIRYIVDNYLAGCGLKSSDLNTNRTAHGLRHTAGTLGLSGGASLREVQDFLGHSDPKQTAVYASFINSGQNNPANRIEISLPD